MLTKELNYFRKQQKEIQLKHPSGGYIVITKESVIGIWNKRHDAIKNGLEKIGHIPFLVKNINDKIDNHISFSRNLNFSDAILNIQNK